MPRREEALSPALAPENFRTAEAKQAATDTQRIAQGFRKAEDVYLADPRYPTEASKYEVLWREHINANGTKGKRSINHAGLALLNRRKAAGYKIKEALKPRDEFIKVEAMRNAYARIFARDPEKARGILSEAFDNADHRTLSALLVDLPAWALGWSAAEMNLHMNRAERLFAPEAVAEMEALDKEEAALRRASAAFDALVNEYYARAKPGLDAAARMKAALEEANGGS
jgi:hypothetical protein